METISNKEKLKALVEFIHKYFNQLLFIPLLFGGVIQIIILFSINPQAIRFFSATQAIADGLSYLAVVLLYIFSIFIVFLITMFYGLATTDFTKLKRKEKEDENETPYKFSHERMPLYAHILIFLATLFCYYIVFIDHPKNLDMTKGEIKNILGSLAMAFMFNFMLSLNLMRFIFFKKEYYFKKNQNVFLGLNFSLCLVFVFIFSVYSASRNISFANFQRIEEKYCCEKNGFVKILYFNDKFIFIERKCKDENTEIIIEKFDVLFEDK